MTDEQIREVLKASQHYMMSRRPKIEWHHVFSKKYCRYKKKLIKRDNHPIWYVFSRIAAIILLAIGLSGGFVLGFKEDVRAEFLSWIVERFSDQAYRYQGTSSETKKISKYSLEGNEPKGYQIIDRMESDNSVDEIFVNDDGKLLLFMAMIPDSEKELYVVSDKDKKTYEVVKVKENRAELYISENAGESNAIVWQNKKGILFCIQGILTKEQLVELAESVNAQ
ncbi:MAG: DUF4367 domain-containing protein [Lachnospiraceae bacterium]|nr:DUF4367 domain-containing protein [Lachnospiraceae bacterium]